MITIEQKKAVKRRFDALKDLLDEHAMRQWAAAEAKELGWGGMTAVAEVTGLGRSTVWSGVHEDPKESRALGRDGRQRRPGGGRKSLTEVDPNLLAKLESIVDADSLGDPMSPLRWTCKSTRNLAAEMNRLGHSVSHSKIGQLLGEIGFGMQGNRKTLEGKSHPDRDAQFRYISRQCVAFQQRGAPVISVDTKKKELVGNYKNGGEEWSKSGMPTKVKVHDFKDKELGKAIPYGVYDIQRNEAWVSVGTDHDTAEFAVQSIGNWWRQMGSKRYARATELYVTADNGGSNGARNRLWKVALQDLANRTGLRISVSHFPPGTSKWNKIEHRLFCHITQNWRARPLVSHDVVVNLIAATTTRKGLKVRARLDQRSYPIGTKVSDEDLARVDIKRHRFHGDWNYTISPE
jgi:hypothetical protein